MFDRLVSVSGVGPRLALAVLSTYTVGQLYSLVMAEDDKGMAKVPGVGKKTAQRLILELKSTFAKDKGFVPVDVIPGQVAMPVPAAAPSAIDDARAALLSMHGYPADYLELTYDCPLCRDTGYINGTQKCACFKKAAVDLLYRQSNVEELLKAENFKPVLHGLLLGQPDQYRNTAHFPRGRCCRARKKPGVRPQFRLVV